MEEDVKRWWNQAERDLSTARYLFEGKKYEECAFFCQQAVEKGLKAFLIGKNKDYPKTHDLLFLAQGIILPSHLKESLKELTLAYIYVRYPERVQVLKMSNKAKVFLKLSEEVLEWIKKVL